MNLCVEYEIYDPILVSNSVNDLTVSLKSLARSTLVSFVAKTDGMKIEQQIYTIELSLKVTVRLFLPSIRVASSSSERIESIRS